MMRRFFAWEGDLTRARFSLGTSMLQPWSVTLFIHGGLIVQVYQKKKIMKNKI